MARSGNRNIKILLLTGLILTVFPVLLVRLWYDTFHSRWFLPCVFLIGIILLIIGIVKAIKEKGLGKFIGEMLIGLLLFGFGFVLTLELIKGKVRGIYIVRGIPIPLIVVMPIAAVAGIYFFIEGMVLLFRGLTDSSRAYRRNFRKIYLKPQRRR